MATKEPSVLALFAALCSGVGVGGSFLIGFGTVLYQSIHWLRYGVWIPVSIDNAWEKISYASSLDPDGSSPIVDWLMNSPLSVSAFGASLFLYCVARPLIGPMLSTPREE